MEAFSVFATLSLVDMISGPLGRIRASMRSLDAGSSTLTQRMGGLALSMGPVALAGGAILGAFGKCVATAAGFEDQMAKVGAISRASSHDMKLLEDRARELGAATQFTAVQVGQAEEYLAMAGFTARQNVAALPGVLNLAAATATDLGRAADISSDILGAFGMKAEEMGRAADVLAMTCSTANTNLELLGDTMKYVAPVARTTGLTIEETAAMAGLLGNVGIKGSQAGTTLKAMLNKMAAPAKEAQAVFQKLGITVKDQAGNLRSPIQILGEMSGKLKQMGTAEQMAAMKAVVGEEAIAGFAELIQQGGIGSLAEYIRTIQKSNGACDEMAARMNDTLAGSVRGLGSAWESLQITIGKYFLPVVAAVVDAITAVIRFFEKFAKSKFGAVFMKLLAAISAAVVGVTAFAAGMWAIGKVAPVISGYLSIVKGMFLSLGWPIWTLIGVCALLYAAWKNDFGGIATVMSRWWNNIKLVVKAVIAIFQSLKGGVWEIRGEFAREIRASGLENLIVNIAKIVFRIKEFFSGIWDRINFDKVVTILAPAILKVRELFDWLGETIGSLFGGSVKSAASEARGFGEIIGTFLSICLETLAAAINGVVNGIDSVISFFRMLAALFTGDFATAANMAENIWNNFVGTLMGFADAFRIGDWVRQAWNNVTEWISGINLFESGMRLIDTLKEGVLSAASSLLDSVKGVFSGIRNLLPFSDAKEGPLSTLTLSGSRLMTTLGEGVQAGFPSLQNTITGKFQALKEGIGGLWNSLFGKEAAGIMAQEPVVPDVPEPSGKIAQARETALQAGTISTQKNYTLHIANITLPNVKDANDFMAQCEAAAAEYGESMA